MASSTEPFSQPTSLSQQLSLDPHRPKDDSDDETSPLLPPPRRESTTEFPGHADEEDYADSDGLYPPHSCWTEAEGWMEGAKDRADPFKTRHCNVYHNIHRIRRDLIESIDDPYSLDQLKAPRMNITIVRPLVDEYYASQDLSIIYCLLVNRSQFIREHAFAAHHQTVNLTRALVCEIVAERVLRRYNEHNPGPRGLLKLATILVAGFDPFQNAPESLLNDVDSDHNIHFFMRDRHWNSSGEGKLTALEVAIVSESKSFLSSGACQKVVDAIYKGTVVYSPTSFIDILPDRWKQRPVSLYDPRRGPILNQYRLMVPRTRTCIELVHFALLLGLFLAVMIRRQSREFDDSALGATEVVFMVYGAGWVLDQIASILEHGWQVYTQNLWSFLDVLFCMIFAAYIGIRLHGIRVADEDAARSAATTAFDVLGCGAPVLIPRLAFNVMSENLLFVGLRGMMRDFLTLTALAVWSFAGFLLSIKWLHNDLYESSEIAKWMVSIWFGLDATGINQSPDFHWFLGPFLMVTFTFLGNTLFLTILISMLSNTFSLIVRNAVQEIQYRRAVVCYMGVKADSLFSYWPPWNILALVILLPLKLVLKSRLFHTINVFFIRVLNAPTLIFIAWYERRTLWRAPDKRGHRPKRIDWGNPNGPRAVHSRGWLEGLLTFWDFCRFNVHGDIQAVFDIEPPSEIHDENDAPSSRPNTGGVAHILGNQFGRPSGPNRKPSSIGPKPGRSGKKVKPPQPRRKSSDKLKHEFPASDSEEPGDEGAPTGYRRPKRGERVDSIIDFNDSNGAMQEANARLNKMEQTLQRMEMMMQQIMEGAAEDNADADEDGEVDGTTSHDSQEAENELQQEFTQ